jgi:hypothetical protein
LEASFGKLDTSDSDDSGQSTPVNEKKADDDMVSIDMTSDTTSLAEPVDIDNSAESGTTRNAKEVTPEPEDKAEPRADSKAEDDTETEDSGKTESNAEDAVPAKNNGHATEAVATSEAKPVNDDSRFPNPYHPSFNRTSFLRERLFERQDKWSTISPVR